MKNSKKNIICKNIFQDNSINITKFNLLMVELINSHNKNRKLTEKYLQA